MPATQQSAEPFDVKALVDWYARHTSVTPKRRQGMRSPNTVGGIENTLAFFLGLARYPAGDPRLKTLGLEPGAYLRCSDSSTGINERDLVLMLEARGATNLTIRAANERAMQRWAKSCLKEEKLAVRQRRRPVLPDPPQLRAEAASSRTIEAFSQAIKAMLVAAHKRGKISYLPWTAAVDDEVKHPASVHYSARSLPNRAQVGHIVSAMATSRRSSRDPAGRPVTVDGGRYRALVWLAGREGPRPEEVIAIRDSWVKLDPADPRVELHWAEIYQPSPQGDGRIRAQVPLKHRDDGEVRVLRPEPKDRDEFIQELQQHRERYVGAGLRSGGQGAVTDPYFFTTHHGLAIDLSNFSEAWWKPVLHEVFAGQGESQFAGLPFRRLRAAAVTDWLVVLGFTTEEAATKAGNSQAIIEKHYKGVLQARPPRVGRAGSDSDLLATLAAAGRGMDDVQWGAFLKSVREVAAERAAADTLFGEG